MSALVDWSPYTGKAVCPGCLQPGHIEVRQLIRLQKPGTFSLAGVQTKFAGRVAWEYRCTACGSTGPAEPH